jgi:hypothetical protein
MQRPTKLGQSDELKTRLSFAVYHPESAPYGTGPSMIKDLHDSGAKFAALNLKSHSQPQTIVMFHSIHTIVLPVPGHLSSLTYPVQLQGTVGVSPCIWQIPCSDHLCRVVAKGRIVCDSGCDCNQTVCVSGAGFRTPIPHCKCLPRATSGPSSFDRFFLLVTNIRTWTLRSKRHKI